MSLNEIASALETDWAFEEAITKSSRQVNLELERQRPAREQELLRQVLNRLDEAKKSRDMDKRKMLVYEASWTLRNVKLI